MACYFIATSYNKSSVSNYFLSLANELANRGHRVFIIVDGQKFGIKNKETNPAILTWPSKRPTSWSDAKFLHKLVKQYRPDCIIANFASDNICTLIGWINRVRLRVVWYHTVSTAIDIDSSKLPMRVKFQYSFHRLRKYLIYLLATKIIANSRASAADAQNLYKIPKDKIVVLPLLIPSAPNKSFEVNFEKIICVGRLNAHKGQENLIRAIPSLKEVFPNIMVKFIGEGEERKRYEDLVNSLDINCSCQFMGNLPLANVLEEMATSAVCVSTSLYEAFGLVNIESQSVGTPVVASKVDGIKEVVLDGKTGFLVPPSDPIKLAEKILILLQQKELRHKMSEQAQSHFEDTFSNKNIYKHAKEIEDLVTSKII